MSLAECINQHPLVRDFLLAIFTGVIASAMYEYLVSRRRDRRLQREFAGLEGKYDEFVRNGGGALTKTEGTITLAYCGGTKFRTKAITQKGDLLWHGEIFMREEAGVLGAGYYSHLSRDDTGIHRVIYNSESKHFNVSGENTSHLSGVKDFKMVWERKG